MSSFCNLASTCLDVLSCNQIKGVVLLLTQSINSFEEYLYQIDKYCDVPKLIPHPIATKGRFSKLVGVELWFTTFEKKT